MKDCNKKIDCSGRREFLVKAAFLAGGVVLTLSGAASAIGTPFEDVVVPIDEKSPLNKVGGSITVDSTVGKIVILRTGEAVGHGVEIDEKVAARHPYVRAYLPVARAQDGTMWSW